MPTAPDPIELGRRNWVNHGNGPVDQIVAAMALSRARQIVGRRVSAVLSPSPLTFAQIELLVMLGPDESAPSALIELGRTLALHPTTVARTVSRLARHGFVERQQDEQDKRVAVISITSDGRDAAAAALKRMRPCNFGLEGWTPEEAGRFAAIVRPLLRSSLGPDTSSAVGVEVGPAEDPHRPQHGPSVNLPDMPPQAWDGLDHEGVCYYSAASSAIRGDGVATQNVDSTLRPHGLTFARFEALMVLSWARLGRMSLKRLSDQLMVHQAAVTNTVDRLEADGLLRRVPHDHDRRVTLAQITNEGRRAASAATTSIAHGLDLGISDAEAREVFALVQQLRRSLGEIA